MKILNAQALAALALLSAAVALPFLPALHRDAKDLALEVRLKSTRAGRVQVFWDSGGGLSERNSSSAAVPAGGGAATYRLPVPAGVYPSLRLDPIDGDGTVVITSVRMVEAGGRLIRPVGLDDFGAQNQIQSLVRDGDGLAVNIAPGGNDPQLILRFSPPLRLFTSLTSLAWQWVPRAAGVFLLLAAAILGIGSAGALRGRLAEGLRRLWSRPSWAIASVSALAVVLSAYPVALGGKSHVAANIEDLRFLYDGTPSLPGYSSPFLTDVKGSDVGAVMWQHVPYSMVEHRAVFRDGEWPLWNRYNSGGIPLLGQGQSMFGDPVHFLVVAANGAAWAWDFKYLAEKWLLALGLGLLVLAVTRRTAAAALVSLAAPFFGFFIYRFNHPAYFSLCLAPWPLYCWVRASQARDVRGAARWAAALVAANLALMCSGTVKEAYMLLLSMNLSGLCVVLAAQEPWGVRLRKLAAASWSAVLLAMISAPAWTTFLATLGLSYTSYNAASAFQIQPSLLIGAFDEAFYRPLTPGGFVFNPSANFLVLAGVLYFLATLRAQSANRTAIVLAASSLVPLALAFGLVPPSWIVQVPFLRNVAHIDNCFSCALIVLWSVAAGAGFCAAADRLGTREGRGDLAIAGALLFALLFHYVAFGQAVQRTVFASEPVFSPLQPGQALGASGFVKAYAVSLVAALAALGWIARRCLAARRLSPGSALGLILCGWLLLWRQGLQPPSAGFEDYTLHPGPRPDFHAASAAMERMRAGQAAGPGRGVGIDGSFFPGWSAAYGLEGIGGPDALMNPYYRELTGDAPISRLWDWRLDLERDAVARARPFLDFMNVRYYFNNPVTGALGSGLVLDGHYDLDTYESPTAWPRAFFVDRVVRYRDPAGLVRLVMKGDGRPFAAIQAGDAAEDALGDLPADPEGRTVEPASGYALTERTTAFTIHAPGPGIAVLCEVFWPRYARAEINGREAKVIRVNHAFQGLVIEKAGDYRVRISYEPRFFRVSLAVAAAGLLLLVASLFAVRSPRGGGTPAAH